MNWQKQTSTRVGIGGLLAILASYLTGNMDAGAAIATAVPAICGLLFNDRQRTPPPMQ